MLALLILSSVGFGREPVLRVSVHHGGKQRVAAALEVPAEPTATVVQGERGPWTVLSRPGDGDGVSVCIGVVQGEAGLDAVAELSTCVRTSDGVSLHSETRDGRWLLEAGLTYWPTGDVIERAIVLETPPTESVFTQVEGLDEWVRLPDSSHVMCEADALIPPVLSVSQPRTRREEAPRTARALFGISKFDDAAARGTCRMIDPLGVELRLHYEVVVDPQAEDCKPFCSVEATLVDAGG